MPGWMIVYYESYTGKSHGNRSVKGTDYHLLEYPPPPPPEALAPDLKPPPPPPRPPLKPRPPPRPPPPPPPYLAISSTSRGTSDPLEENQLLFPERYKRWSTYDSLSKLNSSRASLALSVVKNEYEVPDSQLQLHHLDKVHIPVVPARPVRPIRWT
jgi:hypothetical protein